MEPLPINNISIKGWKSIKSVQVTLGKINILLGANGSGKSSFLSAFGLFDAASENRKHLQNYIEKNGGANQNFHYGTKTTDKVIIDIKIENQYQFNYVLMAGKDDNIIVKNNPDLKLFPERNNIVRSEVAEYEHLSDLKEKLNQLQTHLIIYHFQDTGDTSPLKRVSGIFQTRYLHPDGDNLAAFLCEIKNNYPKNYDSIITAIQFAFPDFKDFIFQKTGETVRLLWNDNNVEHYDFPLSAFSVGTLRFIALSTLLLQPNPPTFNFTNLKPFFEALLFSSIDTINNTLQNATPSTLSKLKTVLHTFGEPENIDTHKGPSVHLKEIYENQYQKIYHGIPIAENIGLKVIREKCPHFDSWLKKLEEYARSPR
ncbi:DUF4276 family protein [uncultured Methanocorpusculum sp.]|nr:DUF4276 family protein [uncultured Methanocorpusculum sp.]